MSKKLSKKKTKQERIREVEAFITKREDKYQARKGALDLEQRELTNAYGAMIIPMREKRDKLEDKKRDLERTLEATSLLDRRTDLIKSLKTVEKELASVQKAESKVELKFEQNMDHWKKKQHKLGLDSAVARISCFHSVKSVIEKTKKRITMARKKLDRLNGVEPEDNKVKGESQLLSEMDKKIPLWNRVLIAGGLVMMVLGVTFYVMFNKKN